MDESQVKTRNRELKKHVNAIHSSNNITLVQRKLFNALLFNAYQDLPNSKKFEISTKELCHLIGYSSRDYKTLKKSLLGLITTAIEWNVISFEDKDDTSRWNASAIISAASIKNGICSYEFSDLMCELLYYPEIYGRLNMNVQAKFKSTYGLALYENCVRYQGIKNTPWFELAVFRRLMGVPDNKYKAYNDFKKRIIQAAIKEVNAYAPIQVTLEEQRVGKSVRKLRFKLTSPDDVRTVERVADQSLYNTLSTEFNLTTNVLDNLFREYSTAYIKEKLEVVINSAAYKEGRIRELSGYFINAVKEDYKPARSSKQHLKENEKQQVAKVQQDNALAEKRSQAYDKYLATITDSYLAKLTPEAYHERVESFSRHIENKNPMVAKWLHKDGLHDERVQSIFYHYLLEHYISRSETILTAETFKALIT